MAFASLLAPFLPVLFKFAVIVFFSILVFHYTISFNSCIKIYRDFIIIGSGLDKHKKIAVIDISKIYAASSDVYITKDNPVYSRNVVAIEYGSDKILYVSIKEKEEFISYLKHFINNNYS